MLKINGEKQDSFIGKSVQEFLLSQNFTAGVIAAELNMEILTADKFDTILKDGDSLEIVCFVAGG
ncbi:MULTISPECIES: sulfur carrier protein ThiS [Campylobacter]|uniref:Thiamine biosynthesis protein ThiS n=1 Tax=Campylobacter suis TaxID=2790657 RepID=A0ABN7K3P1_9BACT|nr:sulfur carrier protein ThiS [Campylobacter suis]CAD7287181.1 hypothetical protein LMG8286_00812 [Campylobacter suis]